MFARARLKLTAWYLIIIMIISLLFSFTVYTNITAEFHKFERQIKFQEEIKDGEIFPLPPRNHIIRFGRPDPKMIEDSKRRLLAALVLINVAILWLSGVAGYFLAGRTLRPIKKMVDEQKRFITDASHELRTPLTALRSEIEVNLRSKNLSLEKAKKLLASNLEEVIHLQELSDNLLILAQNGKLINKAYMVALPLGEIISDAIKKVSPLAKKKQITIAKKITETRVKGVQDRLTEVFIIVLDNAIKFSPEKSTITITAKKEKNSVSVSIKDEGMGIDEKDIAGIFDRFYRADKSRSKTAGYGLGLSIAKKIIEAHSGTISVTSKIDKGSTFTVSLLS